MGLKINGSTSGSIEIDVPAVAGTDTSITIPATSGGQFIVSDSAGDVNIDSGTFFVDSSADSVGIGTTSPSNYDTSADNLVISSSGETGITVVSGTSNGGNIYFADGTTGNEQYRGWITYSHSTDYLRFGTSGTEKLRVRDDGDTAVYTTRTDGTCFQADSSAAANTTAILFAGKYNATAVHTGTISFKVTSNGNVTNTNNSYGSLSDIKLKENIVDAGSQWDDLKAIQVRNYNFKEETGHQTHTQLGVIAQEVELVSPGLVTETPDRDDDNNDLGTTTKSVNYSVLYMKSVKALQEAMTRIETLETANASLEARLTALEGGAS